MRVTECLNSKPSPTVSFEFFPPRTPKAADTLGEVIGTLAELRPDFVSVTFGAGGSTREGSRQLAEELKAKKGLNVIAYLAGYGLSPQDITAVLDAYQAVGIENILAVRGDPPREGFEKHPDSLPHASDLVAFIRPRWGFCMGVAGYPEGHIEAESKERDLAYLKLKVDRGAEYIISQYFYDNRYYFDFVERCRGIGITVPILAGVMPIYNLRMMETLAGMCGATITDALRQGIAALPEGDTEALVGFGIDFAVRQCRQLLESGAPGLHFYTMDRSGSVAGIVKRLRDEGLL